MLGQSKTVWQAEIDAACELIDFWRFNVHYAREILAEQPIANPGRVEPHRPPTARGIRLRDHPVQLHRDRGQPADGADADGQHGDLEAVAHPAARRAPHHGAAGGGRPAAGRDQHAARRRLAVSDVALLHPDLAGIHFTGRHPRSSSCGARWGRTSRNTAPIRDRRRDRRQGLHRGASVGRPRRAADGAGPGAFEFQGQKCSAASRAYVPRSVWKNSRTTRRRDRDAHDGRRHRPVQLHGSGHRRPRVRQAQEGDRPRQAVLEARRDRRGGGRRLDRLFRAAHRGGVGDPTTRYSSEEYFGPILAVHVYDDTPSRRWWTRWSRSRRTP